MLCLFGTGPALCHEFWVEPEKYQVFSDASLTADLRNGQMFNGARLPYLDHRIARFDIVQQDIVTPYEGRLGDMPALTLKNVPPGLLIVLHETTPDDITYESFEAFETFASHKGLGPVRARHLERGLPLSGFVEHYSRHTKLLLPVEHGQGEDRAFGLESEFVVQANPYTTPLTHLPVRLLYQNTPRHAAQVEIFEKDPDGTVNVTLALTDADGLAQVPVKPGYRYLLNAVVLRPSPSETGAVWQTVWASLVFAIPTGEQ